LKNVVYRIIFISTIRDLFMKSILILCLLIVLSFFPSSFAQKLDNPWKDISELSITGPGIRYIIPQKYRTIGLTIPVLKNILNTAPLEFNPNANNKRIILTLPFPDGSSRNFYVVESPIMAPELAAQFPELKTYIINGTNSKSFASGRIDFTPLGFHAIIFSEEGTIFIDPYKMGDNLNYISYYKKDFIKQDVLIFDQPCVVDNPEVRTQIEEIINSGRVTLTGNQLRTYRLAVACTGEYAAFYGGTVGSAMNGIVITVNRVDGVYEKEVDIRMVLVANNSSIVYTNASTDPYTNNNGSTMLGQNQTTLDNIIGSANYDIGHVFSTGGGGVAFLGCVCINGSKARGVTGSPSPVGDPFDIDYVAHEMGHQFGGNHTFNSVISNCGGGNRETSAAYEPGSGSTIMAYAGICGFDNLQTHSDPYFHVKSLDEIIVYTTFGNGNSCPVITNTGNNGPIVSVPTGGFTIPISTPFSLTGSAVDPDNDPLTYCWEEFDLGPAGTWNNPSGNAPIFRSFNPVTFPSRTFPKLSSLLNNTTAIGEILPAYTRSLSFRLIARDNKMGGGGSGYASVSFNVTNTAGPFLVTNPNTNVSLPALSVQTITWNPANTFAAPVNCSAVNIYLSTDGGQTWIISLADNTPNDGSEEVIIPDNQVTTARVRVEAVGNIFFDISDTNFTITGPIPVELISFHVAEIKNGVHIEWETVTETNNKGFSLERSSDKKNFEALAFINGHGTTIERSFYSYSDKSVRTGIFSYRLKQIDHDGTYEYSNVIDVDLGIPNEFALKQNFPNPFNPTTIISYRLPEKGHVSLKIFDAIGSEISSLVNEEKEAGDYDAIFDADKLSSGVYFYTLIANNFMQTNKMILMK